MASIRAIATVVGNMSIGVDIPSLLDPADAFLLHAAIKHDAEYLIAGDRHVLDLKSLFPRPATLTAAAFAERLEYEKYD